jgi:hypothetical protein
MTGTPELGVGIHPVWPFSPVMVTALEGDGEGRLRRAHLMAARSTSTWRWPRSAESATSSGWRAPGWRPVDGGACDSGCRAFDVNGLVTDNVFVAGDVARAPQPMFGYQLVSLEHWGNAVAQAEIAAHNMISAQADRWAHLSVPAFWSTQFGNEILRTVAAANGRQTCG